MCTCVEVFTNHLKMEEIIPQRLIITCEACRSAYYLDAGSEEETAELFNRFQCKNGCERINYSYITVGQILLQPAQSVKPTQTAADFKVASAGQ